MLSKECINNAKKMEIEDWQLKYNDELWESFSDYIEKRVNDMSETEYEKYLWYNWKHNCKTIYANINWEDIEKIPQKKDMKTEFKWDREQFIEDYLDKCSDCIWWEFDDYVVNHYIDFK